MKEYAIIIIVFILFIAASGSSKLEYLKCGSSSSISEVRNWSCRDIIFQEAIYFETSNDVPTILYVRQGQRPEDACSDFLIPFGFPPEVKASIMEQLLNGICSRIASIPDVETVCDRLPPSELIFEIDLAAFKKEYLFTTEASHHISSPDTSEVPADSTKRIASVMQFRRGYSVEASIALFCSHRADECTISSGSSNSRELNSKVNTQAIFGVSAGATEEEFLSNEKRNERFLLELKSFAENKLSTIQTEDAEKKLSERLRSKNYFEVLDVSVDSSESDIKTAYKALARKYHPDKYNGNKQFATEALQYINVAYETLSDAPRRRQHENSLNPSSQGNAGGQTVQFNNNGQGFHFSFGGGGSFSFSFNF